MGKAYDFLKECGIFYVLTTNNGKPCGRPFGAVMEYENDLYLSTGTMKSVYQQIKSNPYIQIVALKAGTRDWIRIDGKAEECLDLSIKEKMLVECPVLKNRFSSAKCEYFALLKITDKKAYMNYNNEIIEID